MRRAAATTAVRIGFTLEQEVHREVQGPGVCHLVSKRADQCKRSERLLNPSPGVKLKIFMCQVSETVKPAFRHMQEGPKRTLYPLSIRNKTADAMLCHSWCTFPWRGPHTVHGAARCNRPSPTVSNCWHAATV